ncbi:aminoglycoside phosphotransferase family protein [Fodinicola acaciae]|uniref:aminoglycoside phosphotransferase family protein n=1 Tax=Fodinicola acaciae TaxID=2681555 RepID=UPI0013D6C843|nr:aminoglycoside phosphotransferase family protein [Fodinicola acaciae]
MSTSSDHFAALETAAAQVRINIHGAQPIRIGSNALYRLPDGVVARISRTGRAATAAKEVAVAQWLATQGVPAVRPLEGIDQPVIVEERAVTFWRELPAHKSGSLGDVGHLLRILHQLPPPTTISLPRLDPFVGLDEETIDRLPRLTPDQRSWLTEQVAHLQHAYHTDAALDPCCVIHGDAHTGNVVTTDDGTTLLLDFERVVVGAPAWDLVSVAVLNDTTGWISAEKYSLFVDSYGEDVTTWPHYGTYRAIRELRMTCYTAQLGNDRADAFGEATKRIECLQGKHGQRPWPWTAM